MPLLGSHLSIAGGYHKAVYQAAEYGMQTVQIFTKNNNQWQAKPLLPKEIELFKQAVEETRLMLPCAHDSYLINLASPKPDDWEKSVQAFGIELERADALGLSGVVAHPGSSLDSPEEEALTRIATALNRLHKEHPNLAVQTWLESTAGQGSNLGHRFEHLAFIIELVEDKSRLGICLDTCHIFAAGYPLKTRKEYDATFKEFDQVVGLKYLRAFHLNDSKKPLGSRVDRHEHLGAGEIGAEVFGWIMQDSRFKELPMYLETKKEKQDGVDMDIVNLQLLNSFIIPKSRKKS